MTDRKETSCQSKSSPIFAKSERPCQPVDLLDNEISIFRDADYKKPDGIVTARRTCGPSGGSVAKWMINRPDDENGRCRVSKAPGPSKNFSQSTLPLTTSSTSSAISFHQRRTVPSRRSKHVRSGVDLEILLGCGVARRIRWVSFANRGRHSAGEFQLNQSCLCLCLFYLIICHQPSELVFDRNRRRKSEFASKPKREHLGLLG